MAVDKDPSIYRDRSTIGSSDELDEYGVWVKSEPQVLRADANGGILKGKDAILPDIEDLPDLDLELGEDLPAPDTTGASIEPTEEMVPDFSDLPSFSLDDEEEEPSENAGADIEEEAITDDSFTELSMDDFLEPEGAESADAAAGEKLEDIDLDFADSSAEKSENEEIALETVSDFDDFLNELSDQPAPTPPSAESEVDDALPEMDIDLDLDEDQPPAETDDEEVSVELSSSEGAAEMAVEERDAHFDDVEAVGRDLEEEERPSRSKPDLSTELLMRIADELSSIKAELSSLKGELSVLRSAVPQEAAVESQADAPHGFFDEEDDETIALTGDELDNILNTADFTEEAGADAGEDIDSDQTDALDFLSDRPDIVDLETPAEQTPADDIEAAEEKTDKEDISIDSIDEAAPAAETAEELSLDDIGVEEIDLGGEPEESDSGIENIALGEDLLNEEPLEMAELRESGVRPMTEAPDDTSYLEEEEAPSAELGLEESIDLTEAVIDEPDLGDFTLEEPQIEEPSIDSIDIDLDLEENLHAEELELPTESEESFEKVLPEGFVVESETGETAVEAEAPAEVEEELEVEESLSPEEIPAVEIEAEEASSELPQNLKQEVKAVLSYMDQLLESLPESKIEEFARSEYFDTYKKLFEELGIS